MDEQPRRGAPKKLASVARAIYGGDAKPEGNGLIAQLMEATGTGEPEDSNCWPDNWLSFQVFSALATQWNVGPSRAIGLRYEAIPVVLKMGGVQDKEHAQILQDLRVMEREALNLFKNS